MATESPRTFKEAVKEAQVEGHRVVELNFPNGDIGGDADSFPDRPILAVLTPLKAEAPRRLSTDSRRSDRRRDEERVSDNGSTASPAPQVKRADNEADETLQRAKQLLEEAREAARVTDEELRLHVTQQYQTKSTSTSSEVSNPPPQPKATQTPDDLAHLPAYPPTPTFGNALTEHPIEQQEEQFEERPGTHTDELVQEVQALQEPKKMLQEEQFEERPETHTDELVQEVQAVQEPKKKLQPAAFQAAPPAPLNLQGLDVELGEQNGDLLAKRATVEGELVRANDLRAAFASVPRVKRHHVDRYMTILVVGETGLGKTSFIRNLFAAFAQDPNMPVNDASPPTSRDLFVADPDALATRIHVRDDVNLTTFHYRVQDTPGYENPEDNMDLVLKYIAAGNEELLKREQDMARDTPIWKGEDPRVDVALYFIAPHRIKPIDVEYIMELSKQVPVVPILAKADSMTSDELRAYREHVRNALEEASKEVGYSVVHDFGGDRLAEAGMPGKVPPFAVISSNQVDLSVGRFWPVRQYPWGTAEAMCSQHSDLAALKKLLFEVAYEDLKVNTEQRYHRFREHGYSGCSDEATTVVVRPEVKRPKKNGNLFTKLVKAVITVGMVYTAGAYFTGGREKVVEEAEIVAEKVKEASEAVRDKVDEVATNLGLKHEEPPPKKRNPFKVW